MIPNKKTPLPTFLPVWEQQFHKIKMLIQKEIEKPKKERKKENLKRMLRECKELKHLIKTINLENEHLLTPLSDWLKRRAESLSTLLLTPLSFEGLSIEQQVLQVTKITATLKAQPDNRAKIREEINANAPSLLEILNQFTDASKSALKANSYRDLVLIVAIVS